MINKKKIVENYEDDCDGEKRYIFMYCFREESIITVALFFSIFCFQLVSGELVTTRVLNTVTNNLHFFLSDITLLFLQTFQNITYKFPFL